MKERRKQSKTAKKTSSQGKTKKLRPTIKDIKLMDEIIKREKIDMKTKEGQQKLLNILQDMVNE